MNTTRYDDDCKDIEFALLLLLGKRMVDVICPARITNNDGGNACVPPYDEDKMLRSIWLKIKEENEL